MSMQQRVSDRPCRLLDVVLSRLLAENENHEAASSHQAAGSG
jgi:hypothetical protein